MQLQVVLQQHKVLLLYFGEENEALNESLLKVQSALAIQQGVQGLTEAYKELSIGTKLAGAAQAIFSTVVGTTSGALKVFRIALISTGIGAIVVGLGLLIANFDKVKKAINGAIDRFNNLGPVMKALLLPITALIEAFKAARKGLEALGLLETEKEKQAKVNAANAKKRAEREKKEAEQRRKDLEKEIELQRQVAEAEQRRFDRKIRLLESEGKSTIRLRKERARQALEEAKRLDRLAQEQVFFKNIYKGQVQEAQIAYNDILKEERD